VVVYTIPNEKVKEFKITKTESNEEFDKYDILVKLEAPSVLNTISREDIVIHSSVAKIFEEIWSSARATKKLLRRRLKRNY
jgi:hypothetical protein